MKTLIAASTVTMHLEDAGLKWRRWLVRLVTAWWKRRAQSWARGDHPATARTASAPPPRKPPAPPVAARAIGVRAYALSMAMSSWGQR